MSNTRPLFVTVRPLRLQVNGLHVTSDLVSASIIQDLSLPTEFGGLIVRPVKGVTDLESHLLVALGFRGSEAERMRFLLSHHAGLKLQP